MNLTAEMHMGGMFIVPDVTVHSYLQIININIRDTEPWETHWISITGIQRSALPAASLFTFIHR